MRLWTRPFADYVTQARAQPGLDRLVLAILALELAFAVAGVWLTLVHPVPVTEAEWAAAEAASGFDWGDTPGRAMILMSSFGVYLAGALVVARVLHGRGPASLIGPFDPALFFGAAVIACAAAALAELFLWSDPLVPAAGWGAVLAWAPLALPLLALQTGTEEIVYRGYLQTQFAARFENPLIWMGVPSLLFALAHIDMAHLVTTGRFADNDGAWFLAILGLGLLAADLTRVTGSIAAAWGWHFGHNLFVVHVVTYRGAGDGLAVWHVPYTAAEAPVDGIALAAMLLYDLALWAALRLWLAEREG